MKIMTIAAAALTAVALFASVPQAEARHKERPISDSHRRSLCKPGSGQEICVMRQGVSPGYDPSGHYHHHHHNNNHWIFIYGSWQPWPYYYGNPHYGNPYYDDDFGVQNRMTCNYAKGLMERRGYRSIRAQDCSGTHYGFTGYKNGRKYKITLNSYSGRYSIRQIG